MTKGKKTRKKRKGAILKRYEKHIITLTDGFNGILALMLYNFFLYIAEIIDIRKLLILIRTESGYFYLNIFTNSNTNKIVVIIWVIAVFAMAFLLGIVIAKIVKKYNKCL